MHIRFRAILICALVTLPLAAQAQTFPGADWQRKTPVVPENPIRCGFAL
jgi:hypothetical protein